MTKPSFLKQNAIAFLIPFTLLLALVITLNSGAFSTHQSQLSVFITIDFIVTIPFIYFLLIRKRQISNLTIAPFLILCVVVASYTIPTANQDTLDLVKTWLIPIIELSVFSIVILKVRKAIRYYSSLSKQQSDFYNILKKTCASIFPEGAAKLVANEIALIYYGFFNFKKIRLKANEFSNYKDSGILTTLSAFIFVIGIEMTVVHLLVIRWSPVFAWILTGLSFYSALQLIGIIRSVPKRPLVINNDYLHLRFGILSDTTIPIEAIKTIDFVGSSAIDKKNKETKTLSLLGEMENSNIIIHLKTPQHLNFLYGKPKSYTTLLLSVDDKHTFKTEIEQLIIR
ncbi:hypothetical protein [Psychroserpens luteolus]|uniref:hypothetical protein n=1 Tax=Psychroserpens luteolus TaxID=2855840 RepID=UPI001E5B2A29|nr:hypothetical protein [Psychroserpens luteolus]MCD2259851.1 hypothetical protein [Psychroserpens luteolus]